MSATTCECGASLPRVSIKVHEDDVDDCGGIPRVDVTLRCRVCGQRHKFTFETEAPVEEGDAT